MYISDKYDILYTYQFGFKEITLNTICLLNNISKALDNDNKKVIGVFLDQKMF